MPLEWKDEYSAGVEKVDEQHKEIFGALNELEAQLSGGNFDESLALATIQHICEETVEHFAFEEECMQRHKCPAAKSNEAAHSAFLATIDGFKSRIGVEGLSEQLVRELHNAAANWIILHICHTDVHLRACVRGRE